MGIRCAELLCTSRTDKYSLIMDQPERRNENEHVIDIRRSVEAAASSSVHGRVTDELDPSQNENRPSNSVRASISLSNISISGNSSSSRRSNAHTRWFRNPLNSGLWISIELAFTLGPILASVVVLALSGHEHPNTPLFAWIVGYATGCVVTLPLLYWRYIHPYHVVEQNSVHTSQNSSSSNGNSTAAHSSSWTHSQEDVHIARLRMGHDFFFGILFVAGFHLVIGGHASSSDAPSLYRLFIAFLIISCMGYAMSFIFWAMTCCCLSFTISVLGFREDLNRIRGATTESINSLPTYKFKLKKSRNSEGSSESGVVAAGTAKERLISGEDAVCCICLAKYANNDELRELPCSHLFHKDCVDKWLKINALCPLCKTGVGDTLLSSLAEATASLRRAESRVGAT